ncbi:MAG: hypothetical protein AUJ98_10750 [Bacteroidetes bacterium CG2_30_33_31]|nr:MAG: hypothetical protein AUJ98_10750 [Bacteroidetes bacterium CG2_30_33_31]
MSKSKLFLLWVITVVITISIMMYQRLTGPTYPAKTDVMLEQQKYHFDLIRTCEIGSECNIDLPIEDTSVEAIIFYKKYRVDEAWTSEKMIRKSIHKNAIFGEGKEISVLSSTLPEQAAAGKIEYHIELYKGESKIAIMDKTPVVVRFKGFVPRYILIPHILFMIISLLFATRAGIETIFKGNNTIKFARVTIIALGIGGLLLGPLVQEYAFGAYWTGWPFGGDWTDNKTLFAFIFWVFAFFVLRKKPQNRLWPILALIVLFSMYLIPHSKGGSELNTSTGKIETGLKK